MGEKRKGTELSAQHFQLKREKGAASRVGFFAPLMHAGRVVCLSQEVCRIDCQVLVASTESGLFCPAEIYEAKSL